MADLLEKRIEAGTWTLTERICSGEKNWVIGHNSGKISHIFPAKFVSLVDSLVDDVTIKSHAKNNGIDYILIVTFGNPKSHPTNTDKLIVNIIVLDSVKYCDVPIDFEPPACLNFIVGESI